MLTTTHNTSILTPFYEWGNISPKSHCKKKITEQDLDLVYLNTQMVNRLPTMQETRVLSLGREVPLEKEMATHSSILAWKIPWTEESGRLQSMGRQRVGHDWATSLHFNLNTKYLKKAEHWRIDAFALWCWRRLLRVPWTARRSNQSILKEISPGCSLEGRRLKLKLQYSCLENSMDGGAW